jgi:hypothetical protein
MPFSGNLRAIEVLAIVLDEPVAACVRERKVTRMSKQTKEKLVVLVVFIAHLVLTDKLANRNVSATARA